MRILYLTPAWFGFDKMLYSGELEITGLPSFSYPLKSLIERGHQIDMVILHSENSEPKLDIRSEWVSKINILKFQHYDLGLINKLRSIIEYREYVKLLIKRNKYDFVYAHGSSPAVVRSVIVGRKIPFAQRLYGTFLWDKIQNNGILKTAIKHAVEFLSFKTQKTFLLATNDGSGADKVVKAIFKGANPPYDFYYWKNGVARLEVTSDEISRFQRVNNNLEPYLFYCARFDGWKRQDRVVNIIKMAKDKGIILKGVFAGPFDTLGDEYYKSIIKLASKEGVLEQCVFLGSISKSEIYMHNRAALASLSLYDVCNVTSVFHEMMASGAMMIIKKDEEVIEYIIDKENGFLVDSDSEALSVILNLLESPSEYQHLRSEIRELSLVLTKDWESRALEEVKLIEGIRQ